MPSLDKAVSPAAPAQPDISETAAEAPPGNRFPPGAMEIKVEPKIPRPRIRLSNGDTP